MNECRKCRELWEDALYGSLDKRQREFFEIHLGRCEECRREYTELRETQVRMEQWERPQPGQAFWAGYWDRLEARMHREKQFDRPPLIRRLFGNWETLRMPRWSFQAAAALILVAVGVFIGRVVLAPPVPPPRPSLAAAEAGGGPGLELASRTQSYVERSKMVLLAIVNFDPDLEDPYVLDLPHKQHLSRQLVREADWLKLQLAETRQHRLQELIEDLETVLLQIANLETAAPAVTVDLVQAGIQSRGIFLKMHLAEVNQPWSRLKTPVRVPDGSQTSKNF